MMPLQVGVGVWNILDSVSVATQSGRSITLNQHPQFLQTKCRFYFQSEPLPLSSWKSCHKMQKKIRRECSIFTKGCAAQRKLSEEVLNIQNIQDENGAPFNSSDGSEWNSIKKDSMRTQLLKKLSEANLHNRILQRKVLETNESLLKCKRELAAMELKLQVVVQLSQEIAREGVKPGSRKINGKYMHSHLALMLEEIHKQLLLQIEDVNAIHLREIPVEWHGMAEHVLVMGSFDGWTRGEQLSPESTGAFTKFSTILRLPPGQYEIKFLVDEKWQLSPQLPTTGEGVAVNNLLLVK